MSSIEVSEYPFDENKSTTCDSVVWGSNVRARFIVNQNSHSDMRCQAIPVTPGSLPEWSVRKDRVGGRYSHRNGSSDYWLQRRTRHPAPPRESARRTAHGWRRASAHDR